RDDPVEGSAEHQRPAGLRGQQQRCDVKARKGLAVGMTREFAGVIFPGQRQAGDVGPVDLCERGIVAAPGIAAVKRPGDVSVARRGYGNSHQERKETSAAYRRGFYSSPFGYTERPVVSDQTRKYDMGILYGSHLSTFTRKVRIALGEKRVDYVLKPIG